MGLFQKNPDTITIRINGSTYDVPVAVAAHVSCLEAGFNTQKRRADSLKTERDHFLKLFNDVNSEATSLYIENREYKHREEQNNKQGVKKMTYRERLAKEHPEEIRIDKWGDVEDASIRGGVYPFRPGIEMLMLDRPWDPHMEFRHARFYRVEYVPDLFQPAMTAVSNIKCIAIDTRIKHEYCITLKDGRKSAGSVWVERDASDEQIREAILNDAVAEVMTKTTDA